MEYFPVVLIDYPSLSLIFPVLLVRSLANPSFVHARLHAIFYYLEKSDVSSATSPNVDSGFYYYFRTHSTYI